MNPLYFGSSDQPLFGAYHGPVSPSARHSGVLLCYPFGYEYMRAHRPFRQLAIRLAREGFHTLRFDYHGTGDSSGAADQGDLSQWVRDIALAADELKDTAGVRRVSFVGLRLGAALAVQASATREDVQKLVLWNPVVSGARYLVELLSMSTEGRVNRGRSLHSRTDADETISVAGFPLTPQLRRAIEGIDLAAFEGLRARSVHMVAAEERDDYRRFRDHLGAYGIPATYRVVDGATGWKETDAVVSTLVPQDLLSEIVRSLTADRDD